MKALPAALALAFLAAPASAYGPPEHFGPRPFPMEDPSHRWAPLRQMEPYWPPHAQGYRAPPSPRPYRRLPQAPPGHVYDWVCLPHCGWFMRRVW